MARKFIKIFFVSAGFFLISIFAESLPAEAECITATSCPEGSFQALPGSCDAPQIDCISRSGGAIYTSFDCICNNSTACPPTTNRATTIDDMLTLCTYYCGTSNTCGGGGVREVRQTGTTSNSITIAKTSEASAQCWSKSDCMKKTGNCQPCFESQATVCGENRGFCYAKPVPATLEISLGGLSEVSDPAQYISKLYEWTISITGILAGIMIMLGGLLYLTAGGSPERLSNAKGYISNALIGLILALTSYFLLQTVNPALLTLRFPKVPLIQAVVPPSDFCEDLAENPDIKITSETGGTQCGSLGIPKSISGASNVPTKCAYGNCTNPEESCEINPEYFGPVAECKKVAGVRLDLFLAERRKKFDYAPGATTNPAEFAANPAILAEKEEITKVCQNWTPRSQNGITYRTYATASCDLISGIGGTAFLKNAGTILAIYTGAQSLYSGAKTGIQATEASSKIGQVLGGAEVGLGAWSVKSTVRAVMKHPTVTLILTSIIGSVAIYEEVNCGSNAALRGNAACSLITLDCNRITKCSDYPNVLIKAEKGPVALSGLDPEDYLGMGGNEIISDICKGDPCNLPFVCMTGGGEDFSLGCSAQDAKCPADAHNDIYRGFVSARQQKGQLCEKDADCQSGKCSGTAVTINDLLVPCDPANPTFRNRYNESTGCVYGISPSELDCGISTEQYRRQANFYKKENLTLKHCQ